ncbi:MAG: type I-E CRISPR-associated protein Cse1/CasA [Gemmatimonadaceae bacterium]
MAYDLKREPWIPWRRRSGAVEWGPPALLVDRLEDDPVVALVAPRADFDGALQEFLIGLLTASLQPPDERAWKALWTRPPSREALQAALDALPPAFDLDGEGPRFFQDLSPVDFADTEPGTVDQLLIDTPGDQTLRLNKDLFVKRERVGRLGRPAAAMAILTLQTYAPAGGQGHRTSLRGGGPLATLVDPRVDDEGRWRAHERPLWYKLWANVETWAQWDDRTPPGAPTSFDAGFPWLSPTRSSGKASGVKTTPSDAHPIQIYFGLPRRIRLEFGGPGRCDLTGVEDERTVTGFRMRNYGVQYAAWRHPLSPHYRQKVDSEWLPVHGQPGGLAWRDWLALTLRAPAGGLREPAATVAAFNRRGASVGLMSYRLHAFGYDMDNMKARGWTDATLPAFVVADEQREALLRNTAEALTDAAGIAASALLGAVKATLFQSPDDASRDLSQVRADLWAATERAFYETMRVIAAPTLDIDQAIETATVRKKMFALALRDDALEVFDRWCPAAGLAPAALRRRVTARYNLTMALSGISKLGEKMFDALGIPLPGGGHAARASKKRARKEAVE